MPVDVDAVSSAASSDSEDDHSDEAPKNENVSEDDHSDEVPKSADADEPVDRFPKKKRAAARQRIWEENGH